MGRDASPRRPLRPSTLNSQLSTINYQPSTKRARRLLLVRPARPAFRPAVRGVLRSCLRRAPRPVPRHVLPDRGPSLNSLLALCNRSIREIERLHKKLNPPARFKTLATPEELRRRMEADLKRAYGDEPSSARQPAIPSAPSPVSLPRASPPAAAAPPSPSSGPGSQPSPLTPQPVRKCDVMAVPLVLSPNGLLRCDWSRARPA